MLLQWCGADRPAKWRAGLILAEQPPRKSWTVDQEASGAAKSHHRRPDLDLPGNHCELWAWSGCNGQALEFT